MNRHIPQKLKSTLRRTLALLLAASTLSGNIVAAETDEQALRELYGSDWQKVAALQPGDSYISGDTMYICTEETYVDWKRVYSKADLNTSDWGNEDRLMLLINEGGAIYLGNDFANSCRTIDNAFNQVGMFFDSATRTRKVLSGVTRDTSGNDGAEYTEEYVYPELAAFVNSHSPGEYPYPDNFRTLGTMNAPYIRDAGKDADNGNHRKFKIILSKDDGTPSGVGLSNKITWEGLIDGYDWLLELKAVNKCNGFTFYMENGKFCIFENIPDEDDLLLRTDRDYAMLYGSRHEGTLEDMPSSDLIMYIGEKTTSKHIEVISLKLEDAEQNPDALENVYGGAIEFYRWEKVTNSSQLPTDNSKVYRAMLVWDDKYFLQGDDFRRKTGGGSMSLYVNEEKTDSAVQGNIAETQQIDLSQNEFYTMGGLGTPYLRFNFKDSDSDNDNCPYYSFQLAGLDDQPSRKWLCDGDNILDICLDTAADGRYGGLDVGIIVGQEGDSDNDAAPGKVKCFFNEDGGKDTGFMHSGNVFYAESSGTGWGYGEFTLYIGKPVVYPAVRQNYVVGEDQFVHISQNGAMFKNVTITVAPGGVLSIESWFMNNGRIVVNGGTLIVQNAANPLGDEQKDDTEDSIMMPFADIHPLVSGSLELCNGGELIIMDDARAAFSNIKATTGSSILNCGILLAETIDLHSSTLDNRPGAALLAGYDFREMLSFRIDNLITDQNGARMPRMVTRLESSVGCITRRKYSSIHNDGWITYSAARMAVKDDSVKASGSGTYTKLTGIKARYLLSQ